MLGLNIIDTTYNDLMTICFVVTAASLSLKSFHARPFQDELYAFLSKVSWAYGSFSDGLAALNTYDVRRMSYFILLQF